MARERDICVNLKVERERAEQKIRTRAKMGAVGTARRWAWPCERGGKYQHDVRAVSGWILETCCKDLDFSLSEGPLQGFEQRHDLTLQAHADDWEWPYEDKGGSKEATVIIQCRWLKGPSLPIIMTFSFHLTENCYNVLIILELAAAGKLLYLVHKPMMPTMHMATLYLCSMQPAQPHVLRGEGGRERERENIKDDS